MWVNQVEQCRPSTPRYSLPITEFYASARAFRIVDGADEFHKGTLARAPFEGLDPEELESLPQFGE